MHAYIHTYILTYIHTYIPTYIHTYLHTYIQTQTPFICTILYMLLAHENIDYRQYSSIRTRAIRRRRRHFVGAAAADFFYRRAAADNLKKLNFILFGITVICYRRPVLIVFFLICGQTTSKNNCSTCI